MADKMCKRCETEKPLTGFYKNASLLDGHDFWCKECRKEYQAGRMSDPDLRATKNAYENARMKKRYAEDSEFREKKKAASREWMAALTPEKRKSVYRNGWLWSMYRLRPEAFEQAKADQGGVCACCGQVPAEWIIDHCHDSGHVRGLVCRKCNNGLGSFDDDIAILEKAVAYLRAFNNRNKEP